MDANLNQMVEQMKRNPAMLQSVMNSRDGQMLLQMLTQGDRGAGLQQAFQSAMRGDTSGMVSLMNRVMQNPEGAKVMERLQKTVQK